MFLIAVLSVRSSLYIIGISGLDQAIDTSSSRSNEYRKISACFSLSNDDIATLPRLPNKRYTKNNLFNLFNAHLMACDMLFSPRFNNKFVDFHRLRIFLQLL